MSNEVEVEEVVVIEPFDDFHRGDVISADKAEGHEDSVNKIKEG